MFSLLKMFILSALFCVLLAGFSQISYGVNSTLITDLPPETDIAVSVREENRITERLCDAQTQAILSYASVSQTCKDIQSTCYTQGHDQPFEFNWYTETFSLLRRRSPHRSEHLEQITVSLPQSPTVDDVFSALSRILLSRIQRLQMNSSTGNTILSQPNPHLPPNSKTTKLSDDCIRFYLSEVKDHMLDSISSRYLSALEVDTYVDTWKITPIPRLHKDLPALRTLTFKSPFTPWACVPEITQLLSLERVVSPPSLLSHAGDIGHGYDDFTQMDATFYQHGKICPNNIYIIYGQNEASSEHTPFCVDEINYKPYSGPQKPELHKISNPILEHIAQYLDFKDGRSLQIAIGRSFRITEPEKLAGARYFYNKSYYALIDQMTIQQKVDSAIVFLEWQINERSTWKAGPLYVTPLKGKSLEINIGSKGYQRAYRILTQLMFTHIHRSVKMDDFVSDLSKIKEVSRRRTYPTHYVKITNDYKPLRTVYPDTD